MSQELSDLFSEEEINAMSEEEKAEYETELAEVLKEEPEPATEPEPEPAPEPEVEEEEEEEAEGEEPDEEVEEEPEPEPEPKVEKPEPAPEPEEREDHKQKLTALRAQFEEGEITLEDYIDKRDEIRDAITTEQIKDTIREEEDARRQAETQAQWQKEQAEFFAENKDLKTGTKLYKMFAQQTQIKLQNPEYNSVDGKSILAEARSEAEAILGVKQEPEPDGTKDEVAEARRKAGGKKKTKSLSDVPTAAEEPTDQSEFVHLDRLADQGKGIELEKALEKMTPEQQERWAMRA